SSAGEHCPHTARVRGSIRAAIVFTDEVSICVSIFPVFPGWPKFKRLEAVTALFPVSQTF
ncbi:MAG: hypothetical protein QF530_13835, partial [SAR202 cluster bacterium]|nr:hypothetical protein [SAR202 cluster bacterium]